MATAKNQGSESKFDTFLLKSTPHHKETDVLKLRIRDNSIRLRLMRAEVDTLSKEGLVAATTAFPAGRTFRYSVESSPANVSSTALFSENEIVVRLPESAVLAWAASEQVSIDDEQVLEDGNTLRILVEKDFVCLTGRDDEDESDMYPHPHAGKASC